MVQDGDWIKKGPHQQHHLMDKLSIKGHEIIVIGYDQLWRSEKGIISERKVFENVSRIHKDAHIKYIRPFFLRFPILDYITFLFSSRIEIKMCIEKFNPDVVIGFTSVLSNYWGVRFARENNIPFIYYWTDVIHALIPFKPFQSIAKMIEKDIIEKSTRVMVINDVLKDYVINFGSNPKITQTITGGVDFERFNPLKTYSYQIRKKYNISDNDLVLLFVGWIYEFSGLKEVVFELSKVKDEFQNIKIVIVGEGDYFHQLKEIVKECSLESRVIFTGKRPYNEIPQLISMSDICLLPAYNNDTMKDIVPIKMYEYLAMNKPIVSTRLPGIIREFGENHGVIYVEKPDDVIRKVTMLDRLEIQKHSKYANEFIKQYDWNGIISKFEDVLIHLKDETRNL